ncbi:hypothetical protein Csa_001540 [Cucumis sativus]|uniref:Uncharacterized protein n=1 Tax=Cucumis sativus TaxID=3659 RepID=A0A0A0LG02_CUCSA|nr:hypothetical protein Csa_001540 [Cucumis sativus]
MNHINIVDFLIKALSSAGFSFLLKPYFTVTHAPPGRGPPIFSVVASPLRRTPSRFLSHSLVYLRKHSYLSPLFFFFSSETETVVQLLTRAIGETAHFSEP